MKIAGTLKAVRAYKREGAFEISLYGNMAQDGAHEPCRVGGEVCFIVDTPYELVARKLWLGDKIDVTIDIPDKEKR